MQGELVFSQQMNEQATPDSETVNISFLPAGTYIAHLKTVKGAPFTGKITIL
jgi:hypothetical protein